MEKLNEVIDFYEMTGDEPELLVWLLELRRHRLDNWKQRAEAAEVEGEKNLLGAHAWEEHARRATAERDVLQAQLAELEKQKPYGYVVITGTGAKKFSTRHPRLRVTNEPPVAVFTRPAPAADLADLVPDELTREAWRQLFINEDYQDTFRCGFSACRAAILRNIEEAK